MKAAVMAPRPATSILRAFMSSLRGVGWRSRAPIRLACSPRCLASDAALHRVRHSLRARQAWASAGSGDDPGLGDEASAVAANAQLLGRRQHEQPPHLLLLVGSGGQRAVVDA